jgi:hypothetical protein
MKSLDVDGTNMSSTETEDLSKVNRWVGMAIGTNNLTHLEENLQVLTRGKTPDVRKLFNIPRLRAQVNQNFDPMHHWHERGRVRFERKVNETFD